MKKKTISVVKKNALNKSNFNAYNLNDYQIYLHLLSKIHTWKYVNGNEIEIPANELQREHRLSAKEYAEVFNLDAKNTYRILKKSVDKLMQTIITVQKEPHVIKIAVCSKAEYKDGYIDIKFTDDIMPYLNVVGGNFTMYELKETKQFKSLYTVRLYELVRQFKYTGWFTYSITELREIMGVGARYKQVTDFKNRTYGQAVDEINEHYPELNLKLEDIKAVTRGTPIVSVVFTFNKSKQQKINYHDRKKGAVTKKIEVKPESNKVYKPSKAQLRYIHDVTHTIKQLQEFNDKQAKYLKFEEVKALSEISTKYLIDLCGSIEKIRLATELLFGAYISKNYYNVARFIEDGKVQKKVIFELNNIQKKLI